MKRILLSVFALVLSVLAYSQVVIDNPRFGMSTAANLKLDKIELRDTATMLWFHVIAGPGNKILIPGESYIQAVGSTQKLFLISAEGIAMNEWVPMSASGDINYQLCFPKIDSSVSKVDYGEGNEGGSWFIYDIQLKPELFKSIVPEEITGNWFRSDNAQWEISLFDSVAVYQSQVWKYKKYAEKDGLGKISLKSDSKNLEIYAKAGDDSTCLIGEAPSKLIKYSKRPNPSVIPEDKESFKLPVFKMDTITYCGYIKDFNTRYPNRTGMIYVNDVLTGDQVSHLIVIEDDGTFNVKFINSNPQVVLVRHPFFNGTIFLEPGKTTFQLFDSGNYVNPLLFMGDCARINTDLQKLKKIYSFDYYQMQEKILDFSPEQYKAWLKELQQKDFDQFAYTVQTYSLCTKAAQIKKLEMDYHYASNIMEYGWNVESAWRKKNNIPQNQREITFKPTQPDSSYYTFLTNDLVNNPLAVLTSEYSTFINRLKYMDYLRGSFKSLTTYDMMTELGKSGYQFTPEEKKLMAAMKEVDSPEVKKIQEEFELKYSVQMGEFHKKYSKNLQPLYKEKKGSVITPEMMEEYLIGQGIILTDQEKAYLSAGKELHDNPLMQKVNSIQSEFAKEISQFFAEHQSFINGVYQERTIPARNERIQKTLGVAPGLATDAMTSQDYCRSIVSEVTPVSNEKLKTYQKNITTPFIANYLALKNNEAKAKVEANKKLKVAVVNEVPKTAADKVFDAIMEKYKGKVVYVDFWATWCSPCRAGIERIKPLKDEMAKENVAFVYITNQTSPKTTYDNMIPSIKGEHYRVSADEWNILCGMFKISGIPHYVLVGKDGKVINPEMGHMENEQLKTLLMKYIKE
jgi:thiol-disulfide isomerase/thioredoxin